MFGNHVQDAGECQAKLSHINSQILTQLTALGAQLDNMEHCLKKSLKKTSASTN